MLTPVQSVRSPRRQVCLCKACLSGGNPLSLLARSVVCPSLELVQKAHLEHARHRFLPSHTSGSQQGAPCTWHWWCSCLLKSDHGPMACPRPCLQTAPEPRHGHSSIWDESDSLIVFGGAHGSHCLADVHVLSLSTGFWSRPTCRGTAPNPRSNHSAALISPTLMLVFGGCSAAGAFMNDVHVLDIATFTWHQPGVVGPAPAARYGHACQVLDGRVVILGGSNAAKAFDGVLTVCTDFGR